MHFLSFLLWIFLLLLFNLLFLALKGNVPVGEWHRRSEARNTPSLAKWIPGVGRRRSAHPGPSNQPI